MLNMTTKEAMLIYGELTQCLYGKNGFGGDTAEIYAYRLGQMNTNGYDGVGHVRREA